ncbi:MAG: lysozyme inhibitor LprI family protein [Burkholderia sp.]
MIFRHYVALSASLALSLALGVAPLARAASFDCRAAHTPIERAICKDPRLSSLDSELADAYRQALANQGSEADGLKAAQRVWLEQRSFADLDQDLLESRYQDRIGELNALPAFPAPGAPVSGPTYALTGAAKQHDFVLRLLKACKPADGDDPSCTGPAQLLIFDKGQTAPIQTIDLANVFVSLEKGGSAPLVNVWSDEDKEGVVNVGDFNFDGNEDFGIQTGNNGSYGLPSYDVYLFDTASRRFVYNNPMSKLIAQSLGFFGVDEQRKELHTMSKDGCCYHDAATYRVEHNVPVAVAHHIEDGLTDPGRMKVVDEALVDGKWRRRVRYTALPKPTP